MKKNQFFAALLMLLIGMTSCTTNENLEVLENQENLESLDAIEGELEDEDQDFFNKSKNNVNSKGIPRPLSLHYLNSKTLRSSQFSKASKWYEEKSKGRQIFRLFKNDNSSRSTGRTNYARIEAEEGLTFKKGSKWYVFEAKMKVSRTFSQPITIAQLFNSKGGPALRVEMRSDGRINIGSIKKERASKNKSNLRISNNSSYAGKTFRVKIRTNGKTIQVFFNGSKKYQGTSRFNGTKNQNDSYHFRWGLYYNKIIPANITNEVSSVERYQE